MTSFSADIGHRELTLVDRVRGINWGLIVLLCMLACVGSATRIRLVVAMPGPILAL